GSSPANPRTASMSSQSEKATTSVRSPTRRRRIQAPWLPGVVRYSPTPVSRMYAAYSSASAGRTAPRQIRAITGASFGSDRGPELEPGLVERRRVLLERLMGLSGDADEAGASDQAGDLARVPRRADDVLLAVEDERRQGDGAAPVAGVVLEDRPRRALERLGRLRTRVVQHRLAEPVDATVHVVAEGAQEQHVVAVP